MRIHRVIIALVLLASIANCARLSELLAVPQVHMQDVSQPQVSEYHLLTLKYYYNVDGDVPTTHYEACARIIRKVAAGDGVFSPLERQAFVALFVTAGAPDELLREFDQINVADVDLEADLKQMKGDHEIALRHLVFATVAISSADGFHDGERQLVYNVADTLQVDRKAVDEIIAGTLEENAGRQRRLKFMGNQVF